MKPLEDLIYQLDPERLSRLAAHLLTMVNPGRAARIDQVLARRTQYVTVALENIYRTHNASAVLRSCECFGIQDVHTIESRHPFNVHESIVQGSAKWLTLKRYRGSDAEERCLTGLKQRGYRVIAMSPEPGSVPVDDLPIDAPLALCFGSEEPGLSQRARSMADLSATVPMHGFTQSLNLSVSAAITLHVLDERVRRSRAPWPLDPRQREALRTLWLARSLASGSQIVRRHLDEAGD